jgi:hypothetical protein
MMLVHVLAKVSIELIEFIIIKSNYFLYAQKVECFFNDFEALVREIDVHALVLQNDPKSIRTSARTPISRTTMRSGNFILKVVSSKICTFLQHHEKNYCAAFVRVNFLLLPYH